MPHDHHLPSTFLTERFTEAVAYVSAVHATQTRKDNAIPYIAHLLAVTGSVIEAGGDEDTAIAALLHDAAEDHGGEARLHDIRARFGARVERIVRDCSDTLVADRADKEPYRERKEKYVAHLRVVELDSATVATADKLHNARSIVTDLLTGGTTSMGKFNGTVPDILWYYESCLAIAREVGVSTILTTPLAFTVAEMRRLLAQPTA